MPGPSGMVQVKNVGKKPFVDLFENSLFTIAPGKTEFIPVEAAGLWFGDPSLIDVGPRQRARFETYKRLRTRYGAFDDDYKDPKTDRMIHVSADEQWEKNKPKCEVYTLEGERLWTVVDDPEGEHVNPASVTVDQSNLVLNRLAAMEEETRILRAALEAANARVPDAPDSSTATSLDEGEKAADSEPTPPSIIPEPTFLPADEDMEDKPTRPGVQNP